VDGIFKTKPLKENVIDVKAVFHAFVYKTSMIEDEGCKMVQEGLMQHYIDIETVEYDADNDDEAAVSSPAGQYSGKLHTTILKRE
jgi:hypothetical protein